MVSVDKSSYYQMIAAMHILAEQASKDGVPVPRNDSKTGAAGKMSISPVPVWPQKADILRRFLTTPPGQRKLQHTITLATAFSHLAFFRSLSWQSAVDVLQVGMYKHLKSGEKISVRRIGQAATMHVLLNGTVNLLVKRKSYDAESGDGAGGNTVRQTLAVFHPGDRFGHLGILEGTWVLPDDLTLNMSAVCDTECELLALDMEAYDRTIKQEDYRRLNLLAAHLSKVPPFSLLPRKRLVVLAALAAVRTVPRGTTMLEQGEIASNLHLIVSGEARICINPGGEETYGRGMGGFSVDITTLGPGDHVGLGNLLLSKKQAPMAGALRAVSQLQVVSIDVVKLSELLKSCGAKAMGKFLHHASRQETTFRERLSSSLLAIANKAQESEDALANQAPMLQSVLSSISVLMELETREGSVIGPAAETLQKIVRRGSLATATLPINPPGGGHHDIRKPEPLLGFPVSSPLTINMNVERQVRRVDTKRDELQTMSRDTRMRRIGSNAIEVCVPLPESKLERLPLPGRVLVHPAATEAKTERTDASVLPTRGTAARPAALQYETLQAHGVLSKLPEDVRIFGYGALEPVEIHGASGGSRGYSGSCVESEQHREGTAALSSSGRQGSSPRARTGEYEGRHEDSEQQDDAYPTATAAGSALPAWWDGIYSCDPAQDSMESVTSFADAHSNSPSSSASSCALNMLLVPGGEHHQEVASRPKNIVTGDGAVNSRPLPGSPVERTRSRFAVESESARDASQPRTPAATLSPRNAPSSPTIHASLSADPPAGTLPRLSVPRSTASADNGIPDSSPVSLAAADPLSTTSYESLPSTVGSPDVQLPPAIPPIRGRLQRGVTPPEDMVTRRGMAPKDASSVISEEPMRKKLSGKLQSGLVSPSGVAAPASERDKWIRNTYFQAVVVPTMPTHKVVRMDLLSHSSGKAGAGKDGLYVQLPKAVPKEKHHEIRDFKKQLEDSKAVEDAEAAAKLQARMLLLQSAKCPATWKGMFGQHEKPRKSFLPQPEPELACYSWEVEQFDSEEGYVDGVMDEESGILYFN